MGEMTTFPTGHLYLMYPAVGTNAILREQDTLLTKSALANAGANTPLLVEGYRTIM